MIERYKETFFTRWINSMFGETSSQFLLGVGIAAALIFYYFMQRMMADKASPKEPKP